MILSSVWYHIPSVLCLLHISSIVFLTIFILLSQKITFSLTIKITIFLDEDSCVYRIVFTVRVADFFFFLNHCLFTPNSFKIIIFLLQFKELFDIFLWFWYPHVQGISTQNQNMQNDASNRLNILNLFDVPYMSNKFIYIGLAWSNTGVGNIRPAKNKFLARDVIFS